MAREKIDNWKATSLKPFNFHHSRYLDANDDPSTSFLVRTPAELVDESARIPKGLKIHRCRPPLRSTIQATRNAREPDRVINARASIRAKRPWIWPILIRERSIRQGVQDGEFPCVERKEREREGENEEGKRKEKEKGKKMKRCLNHVEGTGTNACFFHSRTFWLLLRRSMCTNRPRAGRN